MENPNPSIFTNFYFYPTKETVRKQHTVKYQKKKGFIFMFKCTTL